MNQQQLQDFAHEIKRWRNRQVPKVTQQQLADHIGTTRATIANIESGRYSTRPEWIEEIQRLIAGDGDLARTVTHSLRGETRYLKADFECPSCHRGTVGIEHGATYCLHCATKLGRACPRCEAVSPMMCKFCAECGEPLVVGVARMPENRCEG